MGDMSFAELRAEKSGPLKVEAMIGWEGVRYTDLDGNVLFTWRRPASRDTEFTETEVKDFASKQSWEVIGIIRTNHLD